MQRRLLASVLVASGLLMASTASATLSVALDLSELVQQSDHVILVQVGEQRAIWDDTGRIVTDVTLIVEETMKGDRAPGDTLTLRSLGGAIGDLGMHIEGEPRFTTGERCIVFARRMDGRPYTRPVGMSQGVLPIRERDGVTMVLPGGTGMALVRTVAGGRLVQAPGALLHPRPLAEVRDEVLRLAGTP